MRVKVVNAIPTYFEMSDVARELGIANRTVRQMMARRKLREVARTRRGVHLFDQRDVAMLKVQRAKAKAGAR